MRVKVMACVVTWVACLLMTAGVHAQGTGTADPAIVAQLQRERQALAQNGKINLPQLSHDILTTTNAVETLERAGKDADALAQLKTLEKYAPLSQLPSYNVQMLCSWLYGKLGDATNASACKQRAVAMTEILHQRSGSGTQPSDPVRVIMPSEMIEWVTSQMSRGVHIQPYPYNGAELERVTVTVPLDSHTTKDVYFAVDPRAAATNNSAMTDIFAPIPLDSMSPVQREAVTEAHAKRQQFLADKSFNYPALLSLCRSAMQQAAQREDQGDNAGALAVLRKIDSIHPIDDTPLVGLIGMYSALLGKVGNTAAQTKERLYLFGILQDIAHSGDGLSTQTAINVIAVAEEYTWLNQKQLQRQKQSLVNANGKVYDAMFMIDAQGHSRIYYFNVSDFIHREGEH